MRGKAGSVIVFLGDLPAGLTAKALRIFVQQQITAHTLGRFRVCSNICECSILRITDLDSGLTELHGLVEIRPGALAMHIIERLNGAKLLGQPVTARRYRQRSPIAFMGHATQPSALDGPQPREVEPATVERRRSNLKIELSDSEHGFLDALRGPLRRPWSFRPSKSPGEPSTA